jgi:hypothetical protein
LSTLTALRESGLAEALQLGFRPGPIPHGVRVETVQLLEELVGSDRVELDEGRVFAQEYQYRQAGRFLARADDQDMFWYALRAHARLVNAPQRLSAEQLLYSVLADVGTDPSAASRLAAAARERAAAPDAADGAGDRTSGS